ncbi:MAG: hypothetical protein HN505_12050 [Verrucomicrobia bacterium]|jgi:hypothetical protein|nr:hypothetical protein [Verrucomicrobiota bacterium]
MLQVPVLSSSHPANVSGKSLKSGHCFEFSVLLNGYGYIPCVSRLLVILKKPRSGKALPFFVSLQVQDA